MRKLLGRKHTDGDKAKKSTRANLGDESSFYYDEKLKSWVDKKDKSGTAGSEVGSSDDGSGLPPPPTGPPIGAPPTSSLVSARDARAGGVGTGDTGDAEPTNERGGSSVSNAPPPRPLSRSSSASHVRARYVDVFGNAAPDSGSTRAGQEGNSNGNGIGTGTNNPSLAPVLPGGVGFQAGEYSNLANGASQTPTAPKFFMPVVPPGTGSGTDGTDGDTDCDAVNELGLRVDTAFSGNDAQPPLLKGNAATASPKGHKAKPAVDVLVETDSFTNNNVTIAAATGPAGGTREALGQWAEALGREAEAVSPSRRRQGGGDGFFVPGPPDEPSVVSGDLTTGDPPASLLRSPRGGFASGVRASGGTGLDDEPGILPRRSQGSNAGENSARLSASYGGESFETESVPATDGGSSYAYQPGGAWAQGEDGNWYWYPADGGEPVVWTGETDLSAGQTGTTLTPDLVTASLPDPPASGYDSFPPIAPPDASLVEDETDYDAQWQAALDAAYAAANDAEVSAARSEAETNSLRDELAVRLAEVETLRLAARDETAVSVAQRESGLQNQLRDSITLVHALRAQTEALRVETASATANAAAWEARARDAELRAEDAAAAAADASNKNGGDDGMPGGDAGDAGGDATQAARAAGYRAGHADGTREAHASAAAENDEQMADLLTCLGEEDRKVDRLRSLLEERGMDTGPVMEQLKQENEAALFELVRDDDDDDDDDESLDAGGKKRRQAGADPSEIGETSFASSVHFMADASAMPPVSPINGGQPSGRANQYTPSAGGARVLQDISLPDIPAFDEDETGEVVGANEGGVLSGTSGENSDGTRFAPTNANDAATTSAATSRTNSTPHHNSGPPAFSHDEWNMSGEIARHGETAFSPGGWDLNSPFGEAGGDGVGASLKKNAATVLSPLAAVATVSGITETRNFADPIVETQPGPFGVVEGDDAAFFARLETPGGAEQRESREYPEAQTTAAYPAAQMTGAYAKAQPPQYPAAQPTQYPSAQQYPPAQPQQAQWQQQAHQAHQAQPNHSQFHNPNATPAPAQTQTHSASTSQPASQPAWGVGGGAQPAIFFNPNDVAQTTRQRYQQPEQQTTLAQQQQQQTLAQQPQPQQPSLAQQQQQQQQGYQQQQTPQPSPQQQHQQQYQQWGGGGVEDSAARWGYQNQNDAWRGGATGKY